MVSAMDGSGTRPPTVAGLPVALSEEQRELFASTAQLDACLKSIGLAQFGLVQGIHR